MTTHRSKVLIIGAGPAGYTAAIYAARASLEPVLVQGMTPGGQLTITKDVENYPGFADPVEGPHLMEQMRAQAERYGTKMFFDIITDVDFTQRPFICKADSGDEFVADAVIIATGAQARWLGIPGEQHFQGAGVSACATCDGFFFRGKEVAVVGGGNTALEEALYLTHHASKVTLIHRRDSFRGERILQERVAAHPKIEVVWDSVVEEILGVGGDSFTDPKRVTGVRLRNVKTDAVSDRSLDGVFVAIGHDPATKLFKGKLRMDDEGYLITAPDSTRTDIDGVYAAGDVKDKVFRQAVTAAGMGCMAALEVERFLAGH
ncbi:MULTISPECIES: thioredoxin-disulfide reductase [Azospirillaceae]|uniref:thioredoxin-disulfide reductase n=1 Tax=Azospirillaceae TaxID=2829815 RepID=UPI000B6F5852|nr:MULTISPECIES: thioredoxin-disulfide reductase [Azospirillaceae]MDG5495493.1 thioredoxin-disulfide reductase [Niveispirillum sp. BGYR6]SNS28963.1 thioredoxin reductase (NADPH) [Azospirillum sp. RU38E]SNS47431.1 thioredoxin reductase (NADPH) [Azospirillum sp. RU37A]